jgi:hypothetical protein
MLLFAIFFVLMVLFDFTLGFLLKTEWWIAIFFSIILFLLAFVAYAFYNFTHSAFIMNHEISASMKNAFTHLFTKTYLGIFIFSAAVILAYVLVYFLVGLLFKSFILDNYEEFVNISSIVTIILVYLMFSFNRIYFYFVAEKHIGHH